MSAVEVTRDGSVATVVLNRADKLNALDRPTRWELVGALREVAADDAVRAVVLEDDGPAHAAPPGPYWSACGWVRLRSTPGRE